MKIAEARKKTSTNWKTKEVTWEQFLQKLRTPMRTAETVREYAAMGKAERDAAKEAAGGFVGGALSSPQRKTANVTERSMITLDADHAVKRAWENATILMDYRMACYSTHSHTERNPRLRFILPTDRPMTPDEYPAVARRAAEWIGIDMMDPSTYEAARLMYYPTCPKDGAYVFREQEGPLLRVDEVLRTYGDKDAWKDCALWPTGAEEQALRSRAAKKAGEPTEKPGIIGLFCRAYDVPAAIDLFLSDVYAKAEGGSGDRYTYLAGSTAGGAIVYNDGAFLYSNHATDPCGGQSVNAFDLVRIHKFGELDDVNECEMDMPITKRPSYKAMCEWVNELEEVKAQLVRERTESVANDFGDLTVENTGSDSQAKEYEKKELPPFVVVDLRSKRKLSIDEHALSKYVKENLRFIRVRDDDKQSTRLFVYEAGRYVLRNADSFAGHIKKFISDFMPELVDFGAIRFVQRDVETDLDCISETALNSDEHIINFQNGLLQISEDGKTVKLIPHTPDIYSTIQIPCTWSGMDTPTPVFDKYLDDLTSGDSAVKLLLMEWIGACLSNIQGSRMKKSLFMVGAGNTGKSQLKGLVERIIGRGNFAAVDLSDIEARFGLGDIYGKRLAGSSDMGFLTVAQLRAFKQLTGGDEVKGEFKGEKAFFYKYNGLLWFCMNGLPKFGGDDGKWVYDRIMPVHCDNVIPKEAQDKHLQDKMFAERDGIVYKAVQALLRVIKNGYSFDEPDSVKYARDEYTNTNSSVISFYKECCCPWENGKISHGCTTGRVHKIYLAWCKDNTGGYGKSTNKFREELSKFLGVSSDEMVTRRKGNSYYRSFTLTEETKSLYAKEYGWCDDILLPDDQTESA